MAKAVAGAQKETSKEFGFQEAIERILAGGIVAQVGSDGAHAGYSIPGSEAAPVVTVNQWIMKSTNGLEESISIFHRNGGSQPFLADGKTILNGKFYDYDPKQK